MTVLRQIALMFALIVGGATQSVAACSAETGFSPGDFVGYGTARAQLGLRTAFSSGPEAGLLDGQFGAITGRAMIDLCNAVPPSAGSDEKRFTLDVLEEFIALGDVMGAQQVQDFTFDPVAPAPQALSLAGVPAITGRVLRGNTTAFACGDLTQSVAGSPLAVRTLAALNRILNDPTPVQICALFPAPAGGSDLRDTLERLGTIAAARPGALEVLANPAFRDWVIDDQQNRLRRLVASRDAVITLIDDFNASSQQPGATPYAGSSCTPVHPERTTTYYSITTADIETIKLQISLTPILEGFAEENPVYDSAGALWRDLEPVLESTLGTCILSEIEPLVTGAEELPKTYEFRAGAASQLSAIPVLAEAQDILAEFETRRFATKIEFMLALRSALTTAQTAKVDAIIEVAADTMAAAAQNEDPSFDKARVTIPDEDLLVDPQAVAPQLVVTGAADDAVQSLIDDPNLTSALEGAVITPAPVPEQIKTQVRNSMQPAAQARVTNTVNAQMNLIEPFVRDTWTLSQDLVDAVKAVPYVRASMEDETGENLALHLAPLIGVEYPTLRLFEKALNEVSVSNGALPFSGFVREQVMITALKTVQQPLIVRAFGPTATKDCACIADRREPHLRVYGFYPFWHAPLPGAATDGDTPAPPLHLIDFSQITDIAFYGLEFTYEPLDNGTQNIALHNEEQWHAARRDFVNSAHQHRARVDLAFDMRDWQQWDQIAIDQVVGHISTEITPFDVFETYRIASIRAGIPTMFDRNQVDGVTLIFPDYNGYALSEVNAAKLVNIITSVYEGLPNRDTLAINVAFDFPMLPDTPNDPTLPPILDALAQLLIEQPYVVTKDPAAAGSDPLAPSGRTTEKVVDKVLLFLEMPTTDAKKALRSRIERSNFLRGEQRETVLRSIIPVLPSGGHRLIRASNLATDPPNTQTPDFSQFKDDLVYFRDNFSGVGFWSALHSKSPEVVPLSKELVAEFRPNQPDTGPSDFERGTGWVCGIVCPNRAVIMLGVLGTFAAMLLIIRQAYYVGWAHRIAYHMFYFFGAVPAMCAIMLVALFALWKCDPLSVAPQWMFWGLVAMTSLLSVYKSYQRIKNGPKP